jgi:hypothetical protein
MPRDDDQFKSPTMQELADGLMMPAAELSAPLIAAALLVACLTVHFGVLDSARHFKSAANTAHLRASIRLQDDNTRHVGSNKTDFAG